MMAGLHRDERRRSGRRVFWVIGSLVFRFYAVNFGILFLPWCYLSRLVIMIGAEMNAAGGA